MDLQFPKQLDKAHPFMLFSVYSWTSSGKRNQKVKSYKNPVGSLVLPLAENGITDTISSSWTEEEGLLIGSGKDAITKFFKNKANEMAREFYKIGQYNTGTTLNDFASLLYEGVGFREFEFSFTMVPNNQEDAQTIVDIMKFIKRHSLPEYREWNIKYPDFWKIQAVLPNGEDYIGFIDCVCTNATFNYFPDSVVTVFKTGEPIKVNISLSFKELKKLDRSMFA